jgi:hypothetical protein
MRDDAGDRHVPVSYMCVGVCVLVYVCMSSCCGCPLVAERNEGLSSRVGALTEELQQCSAAVQVLGRGKQ